MVLSTYQPFGAKVTYDSDLSPLPKVTFEVSMTDWLSLLGEPQQGIFVQCGLAYNKKTSCYGKKRLALE